MNTYTLPWITEAVKHIGQREIPGARHNSVIVGFFRSVAAWVRDDETPWCAAFVNHCLKTAGHPVSGSLAARSFEEYGVHCHTFVPGCIVTLHRGNPRDWRGHVGFGIAEDRTRVLLLGGNQNNAVGLSWYPKSRVTSYRHPQLSRRPLSAAEVVAITRRAAAVDEADDR